MRRVTEQGAHRAASGMALVALLGLGAGIANCAEADSIEDEAPPSVDASAGEDAGNDAGTFEDGSDAAVDAEVDACEASEDGCAEPEWVPVATGHSSGLGLSSVWGSGPKDIGAVGDTGTILHYDGTAFTPSTVQLPLGRKPNLRGVWGSGPNDVWIVGDGVVLHYTGPNAGKQAGAQ